MKEQHVARMKRADFVSNSENEGVEGGRPPASFVRQANFRTVSTHRRSGPSVKIHEATNFFWLAVH